MIVFGNCVNVCFFSSAFIRHCWMITGRAIVVSKALFSCFCSNPNALSWWVVHVPFSNTKHLWRCSISRYTLYHFVNELKPCCFETFWVSLGWLWWTARTHFLPSRTWSEARSVFSKESRVDTWRHKRNVAVILAKVTRYSVNRCLSFRSRCGTLEFDPRTFVTMEVMYGNNSTISPVALVWPWPRRVLRKIWSSSNSGRSFR